MLLTDEKSRLRCLENLHNFYADHVLDLSGASISLEFWWFNRNWFSCNSHPRQLTTWKKQCATSFLMCNDLAISLPSYGDQKLHTVEVNWQPNLSIMNSVWQWCDFEFNFSCCYFLVVGNSSNINMNLVSFTHTMYRCVFLTWNHEID